VLRLHLWFLCEYLERALPRPVQRDQLFADIDADAIAEGAAAAFDVQVESGDNRASQRRVARELALYGQTPKRTPVIHRPETPTDDIMTIGELRDRVTAQKPSTWDEAHTSLRTSSVVRAIRHIADQLDDISPPDVVLNTWHEALGHSLTLLLMVVERHRDLIDDTPVLGAYIEAQHGDDHASLPRLSAYFSAKAADRPLSTIASEFVRDCIITVHDQIVRDRLGSSGPIRLAFSHAAEQDAFRYMGGTGRLGREYLRYGMMQQMLLDLNLVTTTDDDARLTAHGEDILARARRSANTI